MNFAFKLGVAAATGSVVVFVALIFGSSRRLPGRENESPAGKEIWFVTDFKPVGTIYVPI